MSTHPRFMTGTSRRREATHPQNIDQRIQIHVGIGSTTPPGMDAAAFKRHRDLVEAIEPRAPEHPADRCIGISDADRVGKHVRSAQPGWFVATCVAQRCSNGSGARKRMQDCEQGHLTAPCPDNRTCSCKDVSSKLKVPACLVLHGHGTRGAAALHVRKVWLGNTTCAAVHVRAARF